MSIEKSEDRTTALGLFNTARSWWRSGVSLAALDLSKTVTHPAAPVTFLLCHAIELYLKAYLRGVGHDLASLKKMGHRVSDQAAAAHDSGLEITEADMEILSHVSETDTAIEARYIVTGFKEHPTTEALAAVAEHLDRSVGLALLKMGVHVREQTFDPQPTASADLAAESIQVLEYIFKTDNSRNRTLVSMASTLSMRPNILQYHLDRLNAANLAIERASYETGSTYWQLTSAGRAYVVERKLT